MISVDSAQFQSASVLPLQPDALANSRVRRILILSDLHLPLGSSQAESVLRNRHFLDAHDWVVLLGDMAAHYGTDAEYSAVRAFIEKLARPYGVVHGNHEFIFAPAVEGTPEHGKRFVAASTAVQREQLHRFEHFYDLSDRFQRGRWPEIGVCTLGFDGLGRDDEGLLEPEHERWLEETIDELVDLPVIFFCHLPLCDERMDAVRYYVAGRRPYMDLSPSVRKRLRDRRLPSFWFSGHVHFRDSHPLATPYLTSDEVWQIHCPDARGFGRADNESWHCDSYSGLTVRSIEIGAGELSVVTTDLQIGRASRRHPFSLSTIRPQDVPESLHPSAIAID